jgi:flagellar basal body-associated protein FliL
MSTLGWIIIALIIGIVLIAIVKAIAIAVIVLVTCRGDGGVEDRARERNQPQPRRVYRSDT